MRDYLEEGNFEEEEVKSSVKTAKEVYEDMDYYEDISVDELISGEGWALQQINYNYVDYDGEKVPCFDIYKVDKVGDDCYLKIEVRVNGVLATELSKAVFMEVCEAYGILFEFD